MLKKLTVNNFTVFEHAEFEFGMLNVIHGENGTGKTHVLKLLYALLGTAFNADFAPWGPGLGRTIPDSAAVTASLAGVFKCGSVADLIRAKAKQAAGSLEAENPNGKFTGSFAVTKRGGGTASAALPATIYASSPTFLPPTPVLHLKSSFALYYDQHFSEFEQTWRDLVLKLRAPAPRVLDPAMAAVADALAGGAGLDYKVDAFENFLIKHKRGDFVPALLAAEGHRKLVTLLALLKNGVIAPGGQLFVDEPEANLNPQLLRVTANAIVGLSGAGVQVFIATHSLFLLREIEVALATAGTTKLARRYFGLHRTERGVRVEQGADPDDAGDVAALEANLDQSERMLDLEFGQ